MSAVEDRLRTGLQAMAEQVQPDSLRPLSAPPRRHWVSQHGASQHGASRRWIAAVAAVAAVAAIVVVINAIAHHDRRPPVSPVPPMPPYYLYSGGGNDSGKILTVRASATGRALDTVPVPAGHFVVALGAASSDRMFVIAEASGPSIRPRFSFQVLRLTAAGRVSSVNTVRFGFASGKTDFHPDSMAVNASGTEFAVAIDPGNGSARTPGGRLDIVSVGTGQVLRSWGAPGMVATSAPSWAGDELSVTTYDSRPVQHGPPVIQVRRFGATTPDGPVLRTGSAIRLRLPGLEDVLTGQLTPDGREVIAWITRRYGDADELAAYSAVTGRLQRVLYGRLGRTQYSMFWPVSIDPSGRHLLIQAQIPLGTVFLGRVDDGRFTALPHGKLTDPSAGLVTW